MRWPETLALIGLLSLFSRAEWYPEVFSSGGAVIRLQDVLFLAVLVVCGPRLLAGTRPGWLTALGAGVLALLAVSALRSPVTDSALVSIAKFAEFVVVGVVLARVVRGLRRPSLVTAVFAVGMAANAIYGLARLAANAGLSGLVSERGPALLGIETAATAAAAVVVWNVARLLRGAEQSERRVALASLVACLVVLAVAKSVLTLALVPALALLAGSVDRRRALQACALGTVLIAAVAAARSTDVRLLVEGERPATAAQVAQPGAPLPLPGEVQGGTLVHRIALGYAGLHAFQRDPLLGTGWLATEQPEIVQDGRYDRLMLERFPRLDPTQLLSAFPTHFHNAYLQLAAEAGVLALLLGVGLLVVALSRCLRRLGARDGDGWDLAAAGWLTLMVCHYFGNVLFGGSVNAAILGFGLAVAGTGTVAAASRRHVGRVVAVVVAVAAVTVVVFEAGSRGPAAASARVVLLEQGRDRGFADGASGAGLVVRNGFTELRTDGATVELAALDAAGAPSAASEVRVAGAPVPTAGAEVVHHDAVGTTLRLRTATGAPVTLSVLFGVPGVYVTAADGPVGLALPPGGVVLDRRERVLLRPLDRTASWTVPALAVVGAATRDDRLVAAYATDAATARTRPGELELAASGATVFLGLTLVPGATSVGDPPAPTLLAGTYARFGRGRRAGRVEDLDRDGTPKSLDIARGAVPLDLHDPAELGMDELAGAGFDGRGRALSRSCRPSPAVPEPCP